MTKKKYTSKEQTIFYIKRFLKVFIPAVVVAIGTMGLSPESLVISTAVPLLTTFDKWAREHDWYKY